jgi:hypothetical protein
MFVLKNEKEMQNSVQKENMCMIIIFYITTNGEATTFNPFNGVLFAMLVENIAHTHFLVG